LFKNERSLEAANSFARVFFLKEGCMDRPGFPTISSCFCSTAFCGSDNSCKKRCFEPGASALREQRSLTDLQMVSAPPLFAEAVALKSGATVDLPAHRRIFSFLILKGFRQIMSLLVCESFSLNCFLY